jgi:multiple sugar transport system ATP-binding protein
LRLLAGLERPTSGTIFLSGKPATDLAPRQRHVGFVFQRPALYPHLDVRRNLAFSWKLQHAHGIRSWFDRKQRRQDDAELDERIAETARLLHLEDLLHRYPGELSGGQQQRVALGRALLRRPALLLLDEPFSNLDLPLRAELRRELHLLLERFPVTMLYVTHDPIEASALADRIVALREGMVQQVGTPEQLFREPVNRFVAGYLGWPRMNLLDGLLARNGDVFGVLVGQDRLPLPAHFQAESLAEGQAVSVGVRPEALRLDGASDCCVALEMCVIATELLGENCLVSLRRGNWDATALLPSAIMREKINRPDSAVEVFIDMSRVHLFERDSGKTLCSAAPADLRAKPEG